MATANEQIILEIFAKTDAAVSNLSEWRRLVNDTKRSMVEMAASTGRGFADIGREFKRAVDKAAESNLKIDPKRIKDAVSVAQREIIAAQKSFSQERQQLAMQAAKEAELQAKSAEDAARGVVKAINQSEKEIVKTKQQSAKEQSRLDAQVAKEAAINAQNTQKVRLAALREQIKVQRQLAQEQAKIAREASKEQTKLSKIDDQFAINQAKEAAAAKQQAILAQTKERRQAVIDLERQVKEQERLKASTVLTTQTLNNLITPEAQAEAKRYEELVAMLTKQIRALATQAGISGSAAARGVVRAAQQASATTGQPLPRDFGTAANQALKNYNAELPKAISGTSKLGQIATYVFSGIFGITAYNAMNKFVQMLKDAVSQAIDFNKALITLSAGVRAVQSTIVGTDQSFNGMINSARKLREEFGIFSTTEAVQAVSMLQYLTRSFGFTQQQFDDLMERVAATSILRGRDFDETARLMASFISSGQSEGLQQLGIAVSRVDVATKAAQLGLVEWGAGYQKTISTLGELGRAQVAYQVIMEKTAADVDNAKLVGDTLTGQLTKQQKALEDQKTILGNAFLPAWVAVVKWFVGFVTTIKQVIFLIMTLGTVITKALIIPIAALASAFTLLNDAVNGNIKSFGDAIDLWWARIQDVLDSLDKRLADSGKKMFDVGAIDPFANAPPPAVIPPTGTGNEDTSDWDKLLKEIYDLYVEYGLKVAEEDQKLQDDLVEIDKEGNEKRLELAQELTDDLLKIAEKRSEDLAKEDEDYQKKLRNLDDDTRKSSEEANKKAREAELKAERDYQERLRKLREQFLFDLEDALRERDAKQVLRLIRQYNLNREQATREYENEKKERQNKLAEELKEIQQQRAEKFAELQQEHAEKIAEINAEAAKEEAERRAQYEKEKLDLDASIQEKKDARIAAYEQELLDLATSNANRLAEMTKAFKDEYGLTQTQVDAIYQLINSYYGPGGLVEGVYTYMVGMIANASKTAQQELAALLALQAQVAGQAAPSTTPDTNPGQWPPPGKASGGSLYAAKPTWVKFGEVPEIASFMPVSRMGTRGNHTLGNLPGSSNSMGLKVWLAPGLEASIVDEAQNQVASRFAEIIREK